MFPADPILIARGKHATLSRERRAQIERVQGIVTMMVSEAHGVLRDCQRDKKAPPQEPQRIDMLIKCLENLQSARSKLVELCTDLQALHGEAWE